MHTGYAPFLLCSVLLGSAVAQYGIKDSYIGEDFFNGFNWETFDDPTHGRVNYVDQNTAQQTNLSYASGNTFIMRADDFSSVAPSARGRNSVRITSHNAYADSIIVLDLQHMPQGCATWPAFWTLSQKGPWPTGGEIDIIEGVNTNTQNLASLHTLPNCTMPQNGQQTGTTISTDCDASVNYNQGCGTSFSKPGSYGVPFNKDNGGYYVMKRTKNSGASVYFWARNDPSVPASVQYGSSVIALDSAWGKPEAIFPTTSCDFETHFDAHQIIFDLTFCGDWAGAPSTFGSAGCGSGTCTDFVNNNPGAFSDAYWEINSLRIYTPIVS